MSTVNGYTKPPMILMDLDQRQKDLTIDVDSIIRDIDVDSIIKDHVQTIDIAPPQETSPERTTVQINNTPVEHYWKNAALVAFATFCQCAINNMALNNALTLGSKADTSGFDLYSNMAFSCFIGNLVKGNWTAVSSSKEQIAVLALFLAWTGVCDLATARSWILGQASMTALFTSFAFVSKMISASILGHRTFTKGPAPDTSDKPSTMRKVGHYGFLAVASGLAAAGNQLLSITNPVTTLLNMGYSKVFAKCGKAAMKSVDTKSAQKCEALLTMAAGITSAILANAAFSMPSTEGMDSKAQLASYTYHYLGPVAGIAFVGWASNLALRAKGPKPAAIEENKSQAESEAPSKPEFKKKHAIHSAAFGVVSGAAFGMQVLAQNGWDVNPISALKSPVVSLGTKLFQYGWQFHSLREVLKGADSLKKRIGIIGAAGLVGVAIPTAIAYGANIGAYVNPLAASAAITAGVVGSFVGKTIRNILIPKPPKHHQEPVAAPATHVEESVV